MRVAAVVVCAAAAAVAVVGGIGHAGRHHRRRFGHPLPLSTLPNSTAFEAAKRTPAPSADACPGWDGLPHPGVFMLGTQKAGSGTLYQALSLHPDIIITLTSKEPNFFWRLIGDRHDTDKLSSAEVYADYIETTFATNVFVQAVDAVEANEMHAFLTMDASIITYKKGDAIAPLLRRVLPCSYYLFTARNPLAQIHSMFWHMKLHHPDDAQYDLADALEAEVAAMTTCRDKMPANKAALLADHKSYLDCLHEINKDTPFRNFVDHALYAFHLVPYLDNNVVPTVLCFEEWTKDISGTVSALTTSWGLPPLSEDELFAINDMPIETHRLPGQEKPVADLSKKLIHSFVAEMEPAVKLFYELFDVDCGWDLGNLG